MPEGPMPLSLVRRATLPRTGYLVIREIPVAALRSSRKEKAAGILSRFGKRLYASLMPLKANGRMFRHWHTHHADRSRLFPVIRTVRREIGAPVANLCARIVFVCGIG